MCEKEVALKRGVIIFWETPKRGVTVLGTPLDFHGFL
jgi:hypothetical protein